ncbi:uncharacterized protein LOC108030776 [Drosophila biarmipes]|uniref:uncharacterized protein LOC108030776 n=1 Tax=Drosophila biarmipes TaxID=125945 RepID=UPI0007E66628|nr:uncharacterized protein LOC108030776 [Drosophila biarmipes]
MITPRVKFTKSVFQLKAHCRRGMSLAWIFLIGFLISVSNPTGGALPNAPPHFRLRRTNLPASKLPHLVHRTSRRIVRIASLYETTLGPQQIHHVGAFNESISTSDRSEYNMWKVLRVDGKNNFYILFFTIYVSYLVYVLF